MASTFGGGPWRAARGEIRACRAALFAAAATAAAILTSLAAAPAHAEDAADVARRMDDRMYYVDAFGRGWEPLLADFDGALRSVTAGGPAPVLRVRDLAMERYAGLREKETTEEGERRAFDLYGVLSAEAVDTARRPEFARRCAVLEVGWAVRLEQKGQDAEARALAVDALRRSPGYEPAFDLLARLAVKEARRLGDADRFAEALALLDESAGALPASSGARGAVEKERQTILTTTGEVAVEWLGSAEQFARVKGGRTDYTEGRLELRAAAGTKAPPPQALATPIRVRNGRYEASARGAGSAVLALGPLEVTSAGTSVVVLAALPDHMVLVPAVAGQEAFLIDRTEVTASEFRNPGSGNGSGAPASSVTFAEASAYCRASGKSLPTLAQWLTAAFGDAGGKARKFPWGAAEPLPGTHFVGGQESPQPVGSCPAGSSAHGCLDMAGNVWEWLADERFIGGGYRRSELTLDLMTKDGDPFNPDVLRVPAPSDDLFERLAPDERARYWAYRPNRNESTLEQIGLRCVIPLGSPRRKP